MKSLTPDDQVRRFGPRSVIELVRPLDNHTALGKCPPCTSFARPLPDITPIERSVALQDSDHFSDVVNAL